MYNDNSRREPAAGRSRTEMVTICLMCKAPLKSWEEAKGQAVCWSCEKYYFPDPGVAVEVKPGERVPEMRVHPPKPWTPGRLAKLPASDRWRTALPRL